MDAETVRLLVTTSGVVIAGLGGAGVTAFVNRKNVQDAHKAERSLWELTKRNEQEEALKSKKEEIYINFLVTLDRYQSLLNRALFNAPKMWDEEEIFQQRQELQALMNTADLLNGTEEVVGAMNNMLSATTRFMLPIEDAINAKRPAEQGSKLIDLTNQVTSAKAALVISMRSSLGQYPEGLAEAIRLRRTEGIKP
ncbi:hypothetical protein ACTAQI_07555 [Pseudarthrobacter sp. alpha12b]